MDIRALRYFIEVVKRHSFTKAAEALYVTQPTISKMVRQLEENWPPADPARGPQLPAHRRRPRHL